MYIYESNWNVQKAVKQETVKSGARKGAARKRPISERGVRGRLFPPRNAETRNAPWFHSKKKKRNSPWRPPTAAKAIPAGEHRPARSDQQPTRRGARHHRVPPPHQGRLPHAGALPAVAPHLAIGTAQPRRRRLGPRQII